MAAGFFGQRTGSLEELALVLLVLLILLLTLLLLLLVILLILLVLLLILLVHGSTPLSIEKYAVSIRPAPPFYAAVTA